MSGKAVVAARFNYPGGDQWFRIRLVHTDRFDVDERSCGLWVNVQTFGAYHNAIGYVADRVRTRPAR